MLWITRKVQSHRFQFALRALNACLLYLLLAVLSAGGVLAMSTPPPEPSPDPIIPQIDPKPETPKLSIGLSGTDIRLSWRKAQDADYYPVYAYAEGDWYHVEDIYNTAVTYDHNQQGWDMRELQFKILACKPKPWYVAIWAWEWGDNKRCSEYSNSVRLPLLDPTFSLSSTVVTLNTLSSLADGTQTILSGSQAYQGSQGPLDDSVDTVGAIRSIVATLRLKDSITQELQDIRWPIYLNTQTFEVTSNKTIAVVPGTYDVEFLATDGDVDYVARALNITLTETQQNIPLVLRTVLGDTDVTIDTVVNLPEFQFQYDPEELTDFTQPKIGVVIDGGNELLMTLNPETGITDQYLSISAGQHNIQLKFYDGILLKGRSDPAQENPNIVPGQPFVMDLIPLHGETTVSLDTVGGNATFNFAIPTIAVEEVGGNPDNLQVVLSLVGLNNQPEDVILSNLAYNANSDVYEAQHIYTGMQADTEMTLSLSFTDLSTEPDQLLGSCVMDNFVLNSDPRSLPCQLTLRRRAIVGGHLLAVLGINVFDATNIPVSGASVYAKRQGTETENEDEDLGTLLGLTGSGSFGTAGYLKTYLVPGSYQLTARYVPIDGSAQETITLSAFDVENQDLILDKSLDQNQPPSITLTAPAEDATIYSGYIIRWVASDPDDQASISLYYDTDNTGYDGTLIVNNLIEGNDTSYSWNASDLPDGDYYIYAKIDDGINEATYNYAIGKLVFISSNSFVSGTVSGIWSIENSPYIVDGDVTITNSNELVINPGVEVRFNGHYKFIVNGKLTAQGTKTDRIIFTRHEPTTESRGWGIRFDGAMEGTSVLSHCVIEYGYADDGEWNSSLDDRGGGVYVNHSNVVIENCHIRNNTATTGGGIYANAAGGNLVVRNNTIENNVAFNHGYIGCGGGGISVYAGRSTTAIIENNLIIGNSYSGNDLNYEGGGGIQLSAGSASVVNNTVYGNSSPKGSGIHTFNGYSGIIKNNIVWGNSDSRNGDQITIETGYDPGSIPEGLDIRYNNIQDEGIVVVYRNTPQGINYTGGVGNISSDPHFVNPYSGDYRLQAGSQSIDGGDPDSDYFNEPRPNGNRIDIGRYGNTSKAGAQQSQYQSIKLNDTGITWGGDYPSGNNTECAGENEQGEAIIAQQDCSHGRDAQAAAGTLTKVGGGAAGFDFTRLNADGSDYAGSGDYNSQPWACVRDNHTGLVWEVKTDDGGIHDKDNTYRWGGKTALVTQQARDDGWGEFYDDWDTLVDGSNSANSGSGLCGLTDWRVPAVNELMGITHKGIYDPSIDTDYFPNTRSSWYWSSSPGLDSIDRALNIHFSRGHSNSAYGGRSNSYAVRLVAGSQPPVSGEQQVHTYIPNHTPDNRYTVHEDGTVTDTWIGLMWQRCSLGQSWDGSTCTGNASSYNWSQALQQGEDNTLGGYSDWRLPNIEELRSIVAYDRRNPAINSNIFPNTLSSFYWSSSPNARASSFAWIVHFDYGSDNNHGRDYGYAVRLVRGGQ